MQLMCALRPGEIVVEMSGDVIPSRRSSNAGRIESSVAGGEPRAAAGRPDNQVGGTRQSRICNARVQSEADGIERCVEIAEHLVEVADSRGELIGHRRANNTVVDDGIVLNVDWRIFKVRSQVRGGWRSLGALAYEPPGGKMIFVGDVVIEFDNTVEAMAGQIAGGLIVFRLGRSGEGGGWPESLQRAVSVQQVHGHWVVRDAIEVEDRVGSSLICGRRFRCVIQSAYQEVLMFTTKKEEELVSENWCTNRETVVLIPRRGLGRGEGILPFKEFVVVEVVGRAVKLIGAGFDDEVCGATRITPNLGLACGHEREVLDGVDGKDDAGDGRDSALVDSGDVPPQVVIVRAFNLPVYRVGPGSIHTRIASAAICGQSGESRGL